MNGKIDIFGKEIDDIKKTQMEVFEIYSFKHKWKFLKYTIATTLAGRLTSRAKMAEKMAEKRVGELENSSIEIIQSKQQPVIRKYICTKISIYFLFCKKKKVIK